ncbi:MAG: hypothetical protein JWO67_3176 [Streptosporangiaceae bacterium]|nr:hypothetical protein [Streptosporangiaceae bacterium]
MAVLGLDYSAGVISGAAIRAAGYSYVIRYVDSPAYGLHSKHIRPDEYRDLIAAGIQVLLVFEVSIDDMLSGHDGGVINARRAAAGADWIGYPRDGLIFMACDEHLHPDEIPTVLAYLDGAASVLELGRTGAYGFSDLIEPAHAGGHASAFWVCGSNPPPSSPAHVYQRNTGSTSVAGVACDINELRRPLPKLTPRRGSEDAVALLKFDPTPMPADVPGGSRWQDLDVQSWPRGPEEKTALVPAVPDGWRGKGSIASLTCGWAYGKTGGVDALADHQVTPQDGPDQAGLMKPSGWIDYVRCFWFADGPEHKDWRVSELYSNVPLIGNKSLPQVELPIFCAFLVVRYSAPGGLFMGIEWER